MIRIAMLCILIVSVCMKHPACAQMPFIIELAVERIDDVTCIFEKEHRICGQT